MKKLPIIFLFSLLACSCKPTVSFDFVKELVFPREDESNDYFYCQCNDSLFIGNPFHSKTIYIHDISSGKILSKMKIPVRQDIRAFYYDSDSSIYFFPYYSTELLRYNKERDKVDTIIDLSINVLSTLKRNGISFGRSLEFIAGPASPLIIKPPHYYISNTIDPQDDRTGQVPLLHFIVNKDSIITDNNIGRFPDNYYEDEKTMFPFNVAITYTINSMSQIVVSHLADHHLYIYDLDGKETIKKCKSKYIKKIPDKISLLDMDKEQLLEKRNSMDVYFGIIFDPYRNCYYRFTKLSDGGNSHNVLNNFAIMILDNNFNIIGEQLFKNTPYMCIGAHVISDGLMLKKTDDYSGSTKYGLFKIKEK